MAFKLILIESLIIIKTDPKRIQNKSKTNLKRRAEWVYNKCIKGEDTFQLMESSDRGFKK